jgi:transcriptional regulator with XRE-family HTH domain
MKDIDRIIASKIRDLREMRELTQSEMASLLSLSTSAYGKLERGETSLLVCRLDEISRALAVPILYFFSDNKENASFPTEDVQNLQNRQRIDALEQDMAKNTKNLSWLVDSMSRLSKKLAVEKEEQKQETEKIKEALLRANIAL